MSKKIIYLLSLLMALSLVFASCKKNSGLDPNSIGGGIENEDNIGETAGDNGLYDDFSKIPVIDKPLVTYNVFTLNGTETYRNSIVVPMGKDGNYMAVFSENRYTSVKSVNDIALDGETITDIVYNLNTASGKEESWRGKQSVGGTKAASVKDSRAAIVVFKIGDDKVVIVASQGAGISRVSTPYADRKWSDDQSELRSNLQFIVGTLDENVGDFKWGTWQDVKIDGKQLYQKIEEISDFKDTSSTQEKFAQFGTHSARGVAVGTKIYVPVIVANQGTSGTPKESMGNIILTGDFANDSNPVWTLNQDKKVAFGQITGKDGFTKQKESRIYDVDSSGATIKYLTVPSGSAASTDRYLFAGTAGNQQPTTTTVKAGDGSPGLVKVKWYGANSYDVKGYKTELTSSPDKILLMHVADTESNLYINLMNSTDLATAPIEKRAFINKKGKASSIDVLNDGTIITLAEEGLASGSDSERKFNVIFKRYSQQYLDSIMNQ